MDVDDVRGHEADGRGGTGTGASRQAARPAGMGPAGGPGVGPAGRPGMGRRPWADRFAEAERAHDARATVRRLARYLARERMLVAAMLATVLVGVVCGVVAPALQSRAVDDVAAGDFAAVPRAVGLMLAAYLAYGACQLLQRFVGAHLSQSMVGRMREDLFSKVISLPVRYLDRHPRGDVMSRMTNDVDNVSTTVSQSLPTLVSGVLTIAGTLAAMLWYSWQLTILTTLVSMLSVVATRVLAGRVRAFSRQRQAYLGQLDGSVEEAISSMRTVIACNHQAAACREFSETSDALTRAGIRTDVYSGVMGPVMNCIGNLDFVVIAAFGGLLATQGMISVGVISAFIVYARQFGRPINEIAQVYGELQTAIAGAERAFEVMDEPAEDMSGTSLKADGETPVSFEHVRFSYESGQPVLRDFTLEVPPGRKVALVGATGSGKTTVASLLERFYDVDAGTVRVAGQDLREVARPSLRSRMAIVLQDTALFSDTVRANLRYANPDATDDDLWRALELSRAADMVRALPQGLDTVLVGAGKELSQGQRQLLAIARACVADPAVLILDEATSSVDTRTEQAVQDAMVQVMRRRTSIVIAHRLSTVRDADLIVVMDHGAIVERGTHEQLLAAGGTYRRLYETQFAGRET
ncbi:ABC transporter ATP-binding protein [bacterium]|nr:ABC transporter ATP-binding protein [bacterium]